MVVRRYSTFLGLAVICSAFSFASHGRHGAAAGTSSTEEITSAPLLQGSAEMALMPETEAKMSVLCLTNEGVPDPTSEANYLPEDHWRHCKGTPLKDNGKGMDTMTSDSPPNPVPSDKAGLGSGAGALTSGDDSNAVPTRDDALNFFGVNSPPDGMGAGASLNPPPIRQDSGPPLQGEVEPTVSPKIMPNQAAPIEITDASAPAPQEPSALPVLASVAISHAPSGPKADVAPSQQLFTLVRRASLSDSAAPSSLPSTGVPQASSESGSAQRLPTLGSGAPESPQAIRLEAPSPSTGLTQSLPTLGSEDPQPPPSFQLKAPSPSTGPAQRLLPTKSGASQSPEAAHLKAPSPSIDPAEGQPTLGSGDPPQASTLKSPSPSMDPTQGLPTLRPEAPQPLQAWIPYENFGTPSASPSDSPILRRGSIIEASSPAASPSANLTKAGGPILSPAPNSATSVAQTIGDNPTQSPAPNPAPSQGPTHALNTSLSTPHDGKDANSPTSILDSAQGELSNASLASESSSPPRVHDELDAEWTYAPKIWHKARGYIFNNMWLAPAHLPTQSPPPSPDHSLPEWTFGTCPLVIPDHKFEGNDVWWGEEPDIGRCCDRCLNMLRKWEDETAELRGETIPSVTDNTCLAYTYSIRTKQCYLKNSIRDHGFIVVQQEAGAMSGWTTGLFTKFQDKYDRVIREYFEEVPMQGSYHEMVTTRKDCPELKKPCGAPHCHQVYAKLKTSFLNDPKESKWDAQRFGSGFG